VKRFDTRYFAFSSYEKLGNASDEFEVRVSIRAISRFRPTGQHFCLSNPSFHLASFVAPREIGAILLFKLLSATKIASNPRSDRYREIFSKTKILKNPLADICSNNNNLFLKCKQKSNLLRI